MDDRGRGGEGEGGPDVVMVCWGSFLAQANGSHRRVAALLGFLRARVGCVAVYSYVEHPSEPWTGEQRRLFADRYPGVPLILDHETPALRAARKLKEAAVAICPSLAARILSLGVPGQAPRHAEIARGGDPVWVVNYVDGLARLNGVRCDRAAVETHDVKSVKRARTTGEPVFSPRGMMRLRAEIGSLAAAATVIAITRAEAAFFRMMGDGEGVLCVSVYEDAAGPKHRRRGPFAHDMLFAASENPLNEQGFLRFARENADWLARRRIALCGRICELPSIRDHAATYNNVTLLGFVDDLPALLGRSRICLSPTEGTGLKIKVVEALRHGVPVLASRHSMDGLPAGYEGCVFPIERDACERLLDDGGALEAASAAALDYAGLMRRDGDRDALAARLRSLAGATRRAAPSGRDDVPTGERGAA